MRDGVVTNIDEKYGRILVRLTLVILGIEPVITAHTKRGARNLVNNLTILIVGSDRTFRTLECTIHLLTKVGESSTG